MLVAFKELRTLLAAGKVRYRYSVTILGTACATTIPVAVIAQRIVKCGAFIYHFLALGHLLSRCPALLFLAI
ncbi:MAG: hypothetical protein ACXV3U_07110 [Halobacteriota archaeon]